MSAPEIQGWYHHDPSAEAVRVRLSIIDGTLALHTLSDRLIARWSPDELENRGIEIFAARWRIGDRRVPDAFLVLESDDDYRAVREVASRLRSVRAVFWRQLAFSAVEAGKAGDWLVVLLVMVAIAILAVWQLA